MGCSHEHCGDFGHPTAEQAVTLARLDDLESDPRLRDYKEASTFSNAILACMQCEMRGEARGIRLALGLPIPGPWHGRKGATT